MVAGRFEIWLASLDPTVGREMQKARPCVIVSPEVMNRLMGTVIIAPMTTGIKSFPSRLPVIFKRKKGEIALDQIRTLDKSRLVKKLGRLKEEEARELCALLTEIFSCE